MDGRSRSSSRERHRHRKRKHKSRRSRSRDRSRSYERNGSIHVNPAFGRSGITSSSSSSSMGYSASQLLQSNNRMEAEICQLKNALLSEQNSKQLEIQRSQMLSMELRNAHMQRDSANKRANDVISERRMMIEMKTEMANRINGVEVSNRMLRDEVAQAKRETEAKNEEIRAITYQLDMVRQQIPAMNERNAALKAKCETMVVQNRQLLEETEAKQKMVEAGLLSVKKAEADLQIANLEIQRLCRELENQQNIENSTEKDKESLELALERKEDELRVANYKNGQAMKAAMENIEKLENRLKSERPAIHTDMTVESIYMAIETMKSTYERQLTRLAEEIEDLRAERMKMDEFGDENDDDDVILDQNQLIEELPDYLQTPRKPDPKKMNELKKTIQVKINLDTDSSSSPLARHQNAHNFFFSPPTSSELIRPGRPSSGPPVDSPVTWHQQKTFQRLSSLIVPLFGTTGIDMHEEEEQQESGHPEVTSTTDSTLQNPSHFMSEDDLLLDEPAEQHSPIHDLDLAEQQLLDEDLNENLED